MLTKLQKWGNSQGIRVPKTLLEQSHLSIEDPIEISAKKGLITIKPASRIRGKYTLKDLVNQMPKDYSAHEVDWGNPAGKEEW